MYFIYKVCLLQEVWLRLRSHFYESFGRRNESRLLVKLKHKHIVGENVTDVVLQLFLCNIFSKRNAGTFDVFSVKRPILCTPSGILPYNRSQYRVEAIVCLYNSLLNKPYSE